MTRALPMQQPEGAQVTMIMIHNQSQQPNLTKIQNQNDRNFLLCKGLGTSANQSIN